MLKKLFLASCAILATMAADKEAWKKRSVYFLLTDRFARTDGSTDACKDMRGYCGGTWKGIENNLDYIQGMGFDAIWISPIVENFDSELWGTGFHGYWAKNFNKLNPNFGTEDDLTSLVKACHERDIYVMVDVVANHIGLVDYDKDHSDFSQVVPFNQPEHYHKNCTIDDQFNLTQRYDCRLEYLPDLDQSNEFVRESLKQWIHDIVNTYGFDGIRIDTVPYVSDDFWKEFAESAGVFQVGEHNVGEPVDMASTLNSLDSIFNYPMFYTIWPVFSEGDSMNKIQERFDEEEVQWNPEDLYQLGQFCDNHDSKRFLARINDVTLFENCLWFAMTAKGIPYYYYGSEQAYGGANETNRDSLWQSMDTNSTLYEKTALVNKARQQTKSFDEKHVMLQIHENVYAYQRGDMVVVLTNQKEKEIEVNSKAQFSSDVKMICNIFDTDDCVDVSDGNVHIKLENGVPKIYTPKVSEEQIQFIM